MANALKKHECCGCGACAQTCSLISMELDGEGFAYPLTDESGCSHCGRCETVCPAKLPEKRVEEPKAYACASLNEDILDTSSSGGVFSHLSAYILSHDGIVFGAVMENGYVVHTEATDPESQIYMRGSKYLQSDTRDTFTKAGEYLEKGRLVLYSGTPCQIAGLKSFLGKEYEKLYTVEVACHGVPSRKVWDSYLARFPEKPEHVSFRDKSQGWNRFSMRLKFSNEEYRKVFSEDPFMKAFLADICLRPSCHICAFNTSKRAADITLADYWGVRSQIPNMDDDKGTSLVLIHTQKGANLLNKVRSTLKIKDADANEAAKSNPILRGPVKPHAKREEFLSRVNAQNFDVLLMTFVKPGFKQRIKKLLKR